AYTVFGAKISQPFLEKWEAYVSVNNLFDKNYEPESGFPAQGRNIWLGVIYNY
ncbi:MAG: TonB-dependent receptor, partial [Nitrospirae bacterium]